MPLSIQSEGTMKRIFDLDSPLMRILADFADLVVLNLLWLLCCLPIITIGASTAALYRCTLNMARKEKSWSAKTFFAAFRSNFPKATAIWLILLVILVVFVFDGFLLYRRALPSFGFLGGLLVVGAVSWLFAKAFAFPLTAQFENSVGKSLSNAVVLAFSHPLRSLLMCALDLLPVILWLLSPAAFSRVAICWILFASAVTAYVNTLILMPVFAPYMSDKSES